MGAWGWRCPLVLLVSHAQCVGDGLDRVNKAAPIEVLDKGEAIAARYRDACRSPGAAVGVRESDHLGFEVGLAMSPPPVRAALILIGEGLVCAFGLGPFIQFFNGAFSEKVLQYKPVETS